MTTVSLSQNNRNELLRVGGAYMREHPCVETFEVAEHVFGFMLNNEDRFELEDFEAVDISDYAYGVADFLTGKRW